MKKPRTDSDWYALCVRVAQARTQKEAAQSVGCCQQSLRDWLNAELFWARRAYGFAIGVVQIERAYLLARSMQLDVIELRAAQQRIQELCDRWIIRYWSHGPAERWDESRRASAALRATRAATQT